MAGAYTAKAAAASSLSIPPGWNLYWPFPGPFPPGYTPDLSFNVDSASTYIPTATHDMSITLRDQDTYETAEPGGSITWSAAIGGTAIQLKFDGDASFSYGLTSAYASVGDYYGAEPTFVFDVDAGDVGSTIVLTATGTPFQGQAVEKTHDILVILVDSYTATFHCSYEFVNPGSIGGKSTGIKVYGDAGDGNPPFGQSDISYSQTGGYTITTNENPDDELDVTAPGEELSGEFQIVVDLVDELYTFNIRQSNGSTGETNCDYTLTIYKNGEQLSQSTKTIDIDYIGWWGSDPINGNTWITFNTETEEVTVVN